jgi:hypothetical protein
VGDFFQDAGGAIAQGTENLVQGAQDVVQQTGSAIAQGTESFVQGAQDFGNGLVQGARDFGSGVQQAAQKGAELFGDYVYQSDPSDGQFMGRDGQLYSPNTPLDQIDPVQPSPGVEPSGETIYYVNGMNTSADFQSGTAQMMADQTGANVINIRNGTNGFATDVSQCADDMIDRSNNPATDTLSDAMYQHAMSGQPMNVVAHSQGGLITDNAVEQTKERMVQEGMPPEEAERRLGVINVRTYGAASPGYESGPSYQHMAHPGDLVALGSGVGNPAVGHDQQGHGNPVRIERGPNGENGHDMRQYIPSMTRAAPA